MGLFVQKGQLTKRKAVFLQGSVHQTMLAGGRVCRFDFPEDCDPNWVRALKKEMGPGTRMFVTNNAMAKDSVCCSGTLFCARAKAPVTQLGPRGARHGVDMGGSLVSFCETPSWGWV